MHDTSNSSPAVAGPKATLQGGPRTNPIRYLRMADLRARYGVSDITIERWIANRGFPRPMVVSRIRLFCIEEVENFEQSKRI